MPTDFTVIMSVRHRFGTGTYTAYEYPRHDEETAFAGTSAEFEFLTPDVDTSEPALLFFTQHGGSGGAGETGYMPSSEVYVNARVVAGGISAGAMRDVGGPNNILRYITTGQMLLIAPNVLRPTTANVLRIECGSHRNSPVDPDSLGYDSFVLDNIVVQFKTRHVTDPTPWPDDLAPS